jgi:DNA processing protein
MTTRRAQSGLRNSDAEKAARLRILRTTQIGPATFHAVLTRFGNAINALRHWAEIEGRLRKTRAATLPSESAIDQELAAIERFGATLIAHEPGYPECLAETEPAPPFIVARGNLDLLARPAVAIVGSRNASALGQRFARTIAGDLGNAGLIVVSGLARGIDTAAHLGAISTGTIAVMAGGVDIVYPPENARLHDRIASEGVILSEMPMGLQPTAQHFPRRNRIVSGLSSGVLVVEATMNSGSLITARLAAEQGREVFAVPGSPLDPRATGTNALLRQGAKLTERADDVLSELTFGTRPVPPLPSTADTQASPPPTAEATTGLEAEILTRLGRTPVETDELVRLTGASPAAVAAALMDLEFAGLLTRHHGHRVALSDSA